MKSSKIKSEQMTFDKLAVMINNGFKESHKDLMDVKHELGQRIDRLEVRFDGLESRFDRLEKRFDVLEVRFDGLESRFDGLEKQVKDGFEENQRQFDKINVDYISKCEHNLLKGRVLKVEKHLAIL
jgi:predicted nuclease with TOPRIM domain